MFQRKLKALGHHNPEGFKLADESDVRHLVVWLEDQKIRHYKIEDRQQLRAIEDPNWVKALKKYLVDVGCPVKNLGQKCAVINWLISYAIRSEYKESAATYNNSNKAASTSGTAPAATQGDNAIGAIDSNDSDLKAGIESIAKVLKLPHHDDHVVVLEAIALIVNECLTTEAIGHAQRSAKTKQVRKLEFVSLTDTSLGFNTNDFCIDEAVKIIRLLQIEELRQLQTQINRVIVTVQKITADPRTDQSLGRVGR